MIKTIIVDDSSIVRDRLVVMLLDVGGVEITCQFNSVEGVLDSVMKAKPDIIILDIKIIGGNGIDLLKQIKDFDPEIIVVMLTNYPYPQYRTECLRLGADYFFDKSTEFLRVEEVFKEFHHREIVI